jgi:hypothetical protein
MRTYYCSEGDVEENRGGGVVMVGRWRVPEPLAFVPVRRARVGI